jgi:16S rRNA (guanine527-N7)-methyltransferase
MSRLEQISREVAAALERGDPELRADDRFMEGLRGYLSELLSWSASMHLTGRSRTAGVIADQVCDSAVMLRCAEEAIGDQRGRVTIRVADIGSGAGFPGIIWKLARPGWDLTLIERRQRIAAFLDRTVSTLGLEKAVIVGKDARDLGADRYDIVVSKAAGRFSTILPIAERIVGNEGFYVTAKADSWRQELARARSAAFEPAVVKEMGAGRGVAVALRRSAP